MGVGDEGRTPPIVERSRTSPITSRASRAGRGLPTRRGSPAPARRRRARGRSRSRARSAACVQVLAATAAASGSRRSSGLVRPFIEYVANLRTGLGGNAAARRSVTGSSTTSPRTRRSRAARIGRRCSPPRCAPGSRDAAPRIRRPRRGPALRAPPARARARRRRRSRPSTASPTLRGAPSRRRPNRARRGRRRHARGAPAGARGALLATRSRTFPSAWCCAIGTGRVLYVDPALGEMVRSQCGLAPAGSRRQVGRRDLAAVRLGPARDRTCASAIATGQRQTLRPGLHRCRAASSTTAPGSWFRSLVPTEASSACSASTTTSRRSSACSRSCARLDRRKSEFIGVLSHELRNPLVGDPLEPLRPRARGRPDRARRRARTATPRAASSIARSGTSRTSSTISST